VFVTDGDGPSWAYPNDGDGPSWPYLARGRATRLKPKQRKPEASNLSRRDRSIDGKLPDKTCRITSPVDPLLTPSFSLYN
jgi:hypothetical protein